MTTNTQTFDDALARSGRRAAWVVAIVVAVLGVGFALAQVKVVVVSVILAMMIAGGVDPITRRLNQSGFRPAVAAAAVVTVSVGAMMVVGTWLMSQAWSAGRAAVPAITNAGSRIGDWLTTGPLGISATDIGAFLGRLGVTPSAGGSTIVTGVLGGAGTLVEVAEGAVLTLVFSTYFLTRRATYGEWLVSMLPGASRAPARTAAVAAYHGLGSYARAITVSGAINAVVVTIVLAVLRIPDAVPLGALAFFLGFFPVVGTLSAGAVATIVALSTRGLVAAITMVVATAVLHHIEVYVVAPLIVGRVIRFHPAALVATLAVGLALAGVVGLFLAGPLLTLVVTAGRAIRSSHERSGLVADEDRGPEPQAAEPLW